MQIKYLSNSSAQSPGLLRKVGTLVVATAAAGVALMFSAVLLTVMLGVAAIAFTYLWWKTRELRKQMRNHPPRGMTVTQEEFEGEIIEGEAIRVDDSRDRIAP